MDRSKPSAVDSEPSAQAAPVLGFGALTEMQVAQFAIESSINAIAIAALDGMLTYVNPAFVKLWRLNGPADAIGSSALEHWGNAGDAQLVIEALLQQESWEGQLRARRRDGTCADLQLSAHLVKDGRGLPVCMMASFADVSAHVQAEQALLASAQRLDEAQRIAQVGSWDLDLVNNVLTWSAEIFRIFEMDPSRFGATYDAFLNAIHPDDRNAVNQVYAESLANRAPYEIVHRLQMSDGRIKWVHERCHSDFDANGKPLRSVGTVQDVTRIRRVEEALRNQNEELEKRVAQRTVMLLAAKDEAERANKAKSDFLAHMSHELRTPLNAILGFGQLLELDPLNAEQSSGVQEILRAGRHLLELVNGVLDLARVESGRFEVTSEPVDVATLLRYAMSFVRPMADSLRLTMRVELAGDFTAIADSSRLRQILINLLSNAVKFNREGGEVVVSCTAMNAKTLRIAVQDSGRGISAGSLPRLFHTFERLEATYTGIQGAGIGLALCKHLVEAMNGSIGVHSAEGAGSTFWIEIPGIA